MQGGRGRRRGAQTQDQVVQFGLGGFEVEGSCQWGLMLADPLSPHEVVSGGIIHRPNERFAQAVGADPSRVDVALVAEFLEESVRLRPADGAIGIRARPEEKLACRRNCPE